MLRSHLNHNYFFYYHKSFHKILIVWAASLIILCLDVYIESYLGKNILGYGGVEYGGRLVSFFKDEPIVGGYINGFYLIIIGCLFCINKDTSNRYRYIILVFSIFFIIAIILTGERSNSIKAIFGFLLFYFFNDFFKLKEKIFSILSLILICIFLINTSDFLKLRYVGQFSKPRIKFLQFSDERNEEDDLGNNLKRDPYINLYQSGFEVLKKYPIFGVGNKNYRVETCSNEKNLRYVCSTHPHQVYFEFLAEHGLVGSMIIF